MRQQTSALSDVIAVGQLSVDKVNVRIDEQPETAEGDMVSGNFFSALGVKLVRGRGFTAQDETDHTQNLVISYGYWTRRFSRDPNVLGKTVYVKSVPFTVMGVTAEGFEGTEAGTSMDFWMPLQNRVEFNVLGESSGEGPTLSAGPDMVVPAPAGSPGPWSEPRTGADTPAKHISDSSVQRAEFA